MAPPTQGTPVTLRIPPDVLAAVDRRAKRERCTRAELLRRIISEAVG